MSDQYLLSFFGDVLGAVVCFCCAKGMYRGIGMTGFRLRWIQLDGMPLKRKSPDRAGQFGKDTVDAFTEIYVRAEPCEKIYIKKIAQIRACPQKSDN